MGFCPHPPSHGDSSVFCGWLYAAVGVSEEKSQRQEKGRELPGTAGDVLRETENEETMKSKKALKERWPSLRALFKINCYSSVRGAL